jgi:hypothetical protein
MLRTGLAALSVGFLLAVAGCGGSTTYSLGPTKTCLTQRGFRVGGKVDFVASTATGGAFLVHLGDNFVTIAFGDTLARGTDIEGAYQRFALPNVKAGLSDVLRRYNNVVTLWHQHPTDSDLALVVGCLR